MIDVAGLQAHGAARGIQNARGYAVWSKTINDLAVANFPQLARDPESRLHQQKVINLVEIPLVVQKSVEQPAPCGQLRRKLRMQHVIIVGDAKTDNGENERRKFHPKRYLGAGVMTCGHSHRTVPEGMREVANEHRLEDCACNQRADGKNTQRNKHAEGRFMHFGKIQRLAMSMIARLVMRMCIRIGMRQMLLLRTAIGAVKCHQKLAPRIE